jgi:hypothetical protein
LSGGNLYIIVHADADAVLVRIAVRRFELVRETLPWGIAT